MTIQLNGSDYHLEKPCYIPELLILLGMENIPVVVELNGEALSPHEFSRIQVKEDDRMEIVSIVAGG